MSVGKKYTLQFDNRKGHSTKSMRRLVLKSSAAATTLSRSLSHSKPPLQALGTLEDTDLKYVGDAYEAWAYEHQACNLTDLARGAIQAYMSVGAVLQAREKVTRLYSNLNLDAFKKNFDVVVRAPRVVPPNGGSTPAGDAVANDESTNFGASVEQAADSSADTNNSKPAAAASNPPASSSLTGGDAKQQPATVEALFNSVPMSKSFRQGLLSLMFLSSKGTFNSYQIAHPNDYITRCSLMVFNAYTPEPSPNAAPTNSKENASAAAAPGNNAEGGTRAPPKAPHEQPEERIVNIGWIQPPAKIPITAQAYVLFALDVITPPRRYHRNYDWYYERIVGYENDNERVAIATWIASNSAVFVAKLLDGMSRLYSGIQVQFHVSPTLTTMLRLPADLSKCPPVRRKFLGMYLSQEGEWILCEMASGKDVFTQELPK